MDPDDWLAAAKRASDDALRASPLSDEQDRLLRISTNHALIALAEGVRALIGVIAAIPVVDEPGEEGWRGDNRD